MQGLSIGPPQALDARWIKGDAGRLNFCTEKASFVSVDGWPLPSSADAAPIARQTASDKSVKIRRTNIAIALQYKKASMPHSTSGRKDEEWHPVEPRDRRRRPEVRRADRLSLGRNRLGQAAHAAAAAQNCGDLEHADPSSRKAGGEGALRRGVAERIAEAGGPAGASRTG
ncbi:hypothetical protein [Bradyrhizobium brasilense]|uniref:hypothetical protein n=1 Tax=Bradyrhizobium brasilense TaxID=1419277 RepID=UPI001E4727DE|nr:hypothetical protein [Bradyrhizobium brasilense]